jgi:hypothetical protein
MLVDGSEYSDNVYNSFRSDLLITEAVEETQVLTSGISAEYGRFDGGVVNVVTKSGGNEFEGALRYSIINDGWTASDPLSGSPENDINANPQFFVGGPIIKDKLWFFIAYETTDFSEQRSISDLVTTDVAGNYLNVNTPYGYQSETEKYQVKLTFSPTPNHRVSFNYVDNSNDQNLRAYVSPGVPESLVPQTNPSDVWKLTYNGILTENMAITANFGKKHQNLTAGGDPNGPNPFYVIDYAGYFEGYDYTGRAQVFENGWFSSGDGGDNRDNTTGVLRLSYFLDTAFGFHNFDFGGDYYKGQRKAANHQSPTLQTTDAYGRRIGANGTPEYLFIPGWNSIWIYSSAREGYASSEQMGLYINDRWEVNDRLTVNIGLRFDDYEAADELGDTTVSGDAISPRLSVNYDITGDNTYYVNATYGVFTGKLLETVTNEVTAQGNPTEVDYTYIGEYGWFTADEIMDPSFIANNYDYSTDGIVYYRNPLIGMYLDGDDLEPQQSTEYTLGFRWNISGTDHLSITYINRTWNGFYDIRRTSDDFSVDDAGQTIYNRYYNLNEDLERDYEAIELTGTWAGKSGWMSNISTGFNATFSDLTGNHEGEGASVPVSTNGIIGDFEAEWAAAGYDINSELNPSGNLFGDVPYAVNAWAMYNIDFGNAGNLQTSLLYRLISGETYSETGSFSTPDPLRGLTGSRTTTYYVNGERGTAQYTPFRSIDLGLRYNLPLWNKVELFLEGNVYNILNSRNVQYWNGGYVADGQGGWVQSQNYYTPTSYYQGRSMEFAAGFRF